MGFSLSNLDPTSDNFLGGGIPGKIGRSVAGIFSFGTTEVLRPDPFGASRHTVFAKSVGGFATGAASGAAAGFATGGPWGAVFGAAIGGGGGAYAGASGATKNYTPLGFLTNVGIGTASGVAGGGIAHAAGLASTPVFAASAPAVAAPAGAPVGPLTEAGTFVSGTGNTVVQGASASTLGFGALGKGVESLGGVALLSSVLQRNSPLGSTTPGTTGISVTSPGPGTTALGPSNGASNYPGVPLSGGTVIATPPAAIVTPAGGTNWLLIGAIAVGGFFLFRKQLGFK